MALILKTSRKLSLMAKKINSADGSILIIAGESSGDKYGADLIRHFKRRHPSLTFFGIGGKQMASEGARLVFTVEDLAVMGIFEVLSHLPRLKKIFNRIKKEIQKRKPQAAVLIDSPDFNLRLAKRLKRQSVPILYYISPTVWAWRAGRLKAIKRTVSKMMLIFPFEEKIYTTHRIPATYIGHPLKERIKVSLDKETFMKKYDLNPQKKLIALLPGSRAGELKAHLPVLIQALPEIQREFDAQFVLLLAENLDKALLSDLLPCLPHELKILTEDHYEAMASSDVVLSACGTANLEAALIKTPFISFYRILPITYFFGQWISKIKNYSIVNILAGQRVAPELIQHNFTVKNILQEIRKILASEKVRSEMFYHFKRINDLLGEKIASQNAVQELEKLIYGDATKGVDPTNK